MSDLDARALKAQLEAVRKERDAALARLDAVRDERDQLRLRNAKLEAVADAARNHDCVEKPTCRICEAIAAFDAKETP